MDETPHQDLGPYQLKALLGRGEAGPVYKAWDGSLERWVAIQHLRAQDDDDRDRLRREARIAGDLEHPAVVRVFDIFDRDRDDWIVRELVEGTDLATLLRDGPLDARLAADYGRQIASGLDAAHGAGVVHRNLKTANILVLLAASSPGGQTEQPRHSVKILELGMVRPSLRSDGTDPMDAGTILEMSRVLAPEQARGEKIDARTDLFGLGALLYELLTARSPFVADTIVETVRRVESHVPPSVARLHARIPAALSELVDLAWCGVSRIPRPSRSRSASLQR